MTPDEIEKLAKEKYPLPKKPCKREKDTILRLRQRFIERESLALIEAPDYRVKHLNK